MEDIIATPLKGIYVNETRTKLQYLIRQIEGGGKDFQQRYQSLPAEQLQAYLKFRHPIMMQVYSYLHRETKKEPDDYFPAYCRFQYLLEKLDPALVEIPLMDCTHHILMNDIEYVCTADITTILTVREAYAFFGLELAFWPQNK